MRGDSTDRAGGQSPPDHAGVTQGGRLTVYDSPDDRQRRLADVLPQHVRAAEVGDRLDRRRGARLHGRRVDLPAPAAAAPHPQLRRDRLEARGVPPALARPRLVPPPGWLRLVALAGRGRPRRRRCRRWRQVDVRQRVAPVLERVVGGGSGGGCGGECAPTRARPPATDSGDDVSAGRDRQQPNELEPAPRGFPIHLILFLN